MALFIDVFVFGLMSYFTWRYTYILPYTVFPIRRCFRFISNESLYNKTNKLTSSGPNKAPAQLWYLTKLIRVSSIREKNASLATQ